MGFDSRANIAQPRARFGGGFNAQHQALISHFNEPLCLDRRFASKIHPAGIAMPSVEQRGDIDVQNIALFQNLVARNAMADHMVQRDTAGMRIAAIAHGRRDRAAVQNHLADLIVNLARRDTRLHPIGHLIEHARGELTRLAHAFKALGRMQLDRAVAIDGLITFNDLILVHAELCSGSPRGLRVRTYAGVIRLE